jgi:hypothetical protein
MADWWDIVKTGADIVLSGGKAYLDYKSKKKQNEMIQKSYDDYMAQQKEAAKVAQRAISTNLTPMTVFNKPSTKAEITDFTALAANGGLMSLATGSRPTYQEGIGPLVEQVSMQEDVSEVPAGGDMPPELAELIRSLHAEHYERLKAMGKTDEEIMKILMDMAMSMIQADAQGKTPEGMGVEVQAEEMIDVKNGGIMGLRKGGRSNYRSQGIVDESEDIEVMDPESLGDYELKMEEGVDIGPMASDPSVDASRNEAAMMLFNKSLDQLTEIELIKLDEFLASQASGPSDKYEAQIQKLMKEMNISRELAEALILGSDPASIEFLKNLRQGGIAGLRHGGRPGYETGLGPVGRGRPPAETETETEWISRVSPTKEVDTIHRIYEEGGNEALQAYLERNPDLTYKYVINADAMSGELFVMPNKLHPDNMDMENIIMLKSGDNGVIDMSGMFEEKKAKGGRVKRDNGGIMNLGGLEKDYRTTGGFVDIGGRERADDVPARLSRNEFVMTADAVRAAGGGSINKGAQRMYNVMKHLETKGAAA